MEGFTTSHFAFPLVFPALHCFVIGDLKSAGPQPCHDGPLRFCDGEWYDIPRKRQKGKCGIRPVQQMLENVAAPFPCIKCVLLRLSRVDESLANVFREERVGVQVAGTEDDMVDAFHSVSIGEAKAF